MSLPSAQDDKRVGTDAAAQHLMETAGEHSLRASYQGTIDRLRAELIEAKKSRDISPLIWVGAKSLTMRPDGDSFRIWFTTDSGREISLCHCPLRDGEIVIWLDSDHVRLATWPDATGTRQHRR